MPPVGSVSLVINGTKVADDSMDEGVLSDSGGESIHEKSHQYPKMHMQISEFASKAMAKKTQKNRMVQVREHIQAVTVENTINHAQLQTLLLDRSFCSIIFHLFDEKGEGSLDQTTWIEQLRYWTRVSYLNNVCNHNVDFPYFIVKFGQHQISST